MLLEVITVRSPDLYTTRIPAIVMSDWIHDMLMRITKGLRVPEESIRKVARMGYNRGLKKRHRGIKRLDSRIDS